MNQQETTASNNTENQDRESWARDTLYSLATDAIRENQRYRRWRMVMRLLMIAFVLVVFLGSASMLVGIPDEMGGMTTDAHVGVVEVTGVIASELEASSDSVIENLEDAFANENAVAVLLRINSPGGSPVEAGRINDAIVRLRGEYEDKKVYTVVDDVCASGGYYIAAAADEIYADKASIIGSIGVLSSSFGFVGLMEKIGVERRLETAGKNKGMLDPFSATREQDVAHLREILDVVHQQFIDVVLEGRGERLRGTQEELFSGLFWDGEQALELGLIDQLGDSHALLSKLSEETGQELKLVTYSNIDPIESLLRDLGASLANGIKAGADFRLY